MKMKVAEQLARKMVGTTNRRAKPTRKNVKARAARRPRRRHVVRDTRRVVVAKERKRTRGSPISAAWVARKAWDCYQSIGFVPLRIAL